MTTIQLPLYNRRLRWMVLLLMLLGCNYYKPIQQNTPTSKEKVAVLQQQQDRTMILHVNDQHFLLEKVHVDIANEQLSGTLNRVPPENLQYLSDKRQKYTYEPKQPAVLHEVHVYTQMDRQLSSGDEVTIAAKDVQKIEVIERDSNRSTTNTILAAAGVTAGTLLLIGIIAAATKSSCPFVSVYDGEAWQLQGESFGGAVYPALARDDYMLLPAARAGEPISLCISNELKERQYTDMADLWWIGYRSGERVVPTQDGGIAVITREWLPSRASLNNHKDVLPLVSKTDKLPCSFNDTTATTGVNQLHLQYASPGEKGSYSLVLQLRNAYWLDYLHGEFTKHFGTYFNQWRQEQSAMPASQLMAWQQAQHIPLTIHIKQDGQWQPLAQLPSVGPLMNRELAIPLPGMQGPVELQLSTGFMFWEIDKATLALAAPADATRITKQSPIRAVDEKGQDVLPLLLQPDGRYLEQPDIGNRAYLEYKGQSGISSWTHHAAVLHTRGYYEPIRDYSGAPDLPFLQRFRQDGAYTAYSLEHYQSLMQQARLAKTQ
ncbi:MAG: hypothetical protein MUF29_06060 [Chitinophagaceae bacterium]|nr:hypothetical protein [Chitinophagaceae bacterium]